MVYGSEAGGVHMSNKTLVPDKLHGYLLQVIHMLYELISVDDRGVSIGKLDDVAVEIDGKVIAEQLKSVLYFILGYMWTVHHSVVKSMPDIPARPLDLRCS